MEATSPERRCEIVVAIFSERPHQSDVLKSLWLSSQSDHIGATSPERRCEVAPGFGSDLDGSLREVDPGPISCLQEARERATSGRRSNEVALRG